jgi:diaminopimelate epimerase
MLMQFSKSEGLGNDFIVVGNEADNTDFSRLAKQICHRHFGVGADGLIVFRTLAPSASAHFSMRIFNADGSEAELSGNGLRCLGVHLIHLGLHQAPDLRVETRAGLKKLRLTGSNALEYYFEVDMGPPILERSRIPLNLASAAVHLTGYELKVDDKVYPVTITSMVNPHCSLFVNDFAANGWEEIGRQIEIHPTFPDRTNVEFIKVKSRNEIEVRFWERGVGKTNASGTGSCAAVVAAILNGYTARQVKVETLGGSLQISWEADDSLCLKGPARYICKGDYDGG